MRLRASAGNVVSYCRHSRAERRLPVDIGLDAVAVADVDGGGAGQPRDRAVQRLDAPAGHLVHVDIERRLVELDHVDAVGFERARLGVERSANAIAIFTRSP